MSRAGFEPVIQPTSAEDPRLRPRGHWIGPISVGDLKKNTIDQCAFDP
jgi:hypothetical protein